MMRDVHLSGNSCGLIYLNMNSYYEHSLFVFANIFVDNNLHDNQLQLRHIPAIEKLKTDGSNFIVFVP